MALFRGRYKSILLDADSYLLQVVSYLHRNPIRAGITDRRLKERIEELAELSKSQEQT
jgi:hypothetical protein